MLGAVPLERSSVDAVAETRALPFVKRWVRLRGWRGVC